MPVFATEAVSDASFEAMVAGLGAGFPSPEMVASAAGLFTREVVPERREGRLVWGDEEFAALDGLVSRRLDRVLRVGTVDRQGRRRVVLARADRAMVEGPRWRVEVSPGTFAVRSRDVVRQDRAAERAREAAEDYAALVASLRAASACFPGCRCGDEAWHEPEGGVSRLREWSAKSRARMVQRLGELDYSPLFADRGVPAMVTLTYPGDWLAVVPSASVAQRHVGLLRKRWLRRWGSPLVGVWKREFQDRGAPHFHIECTPPDDPEFPAWLSRTWAEIVDAAWCGAWCWDAGLGGEGRPCCEFGRHLVAGTGVDYAEGARATDPKRLAVYFAKHSGFSSKEYQNTVPWAWLHEPACEDTGCDGCSGEGSGRFWGVWGLKRAVASVEVAPDVARAVWRTVARHAHANRYYVSRPVWRKVYSERLDTTTGELVTSWRWRKRSSKRPVQRGRGAAGFVMVNDGPAFAAQLAAVATAVERPRYPKVYRRRDGSVIRSSAGCGPVGFLP